MRTDLIGQVFGRLCVIKKYDTQNGKQRWLCKCSCGNTAIVTTGNLRYGTTKSCGCLRSETTKQMFKKHGHANTAHRSPLYSVWASMKSRCHNPNEVGFKNYGGRGIDISPEWDSFEAFLTWALRSGYQYGLEIDRINNEKGYSPDNCRWVTRSENQRNKRNNRLLTINGKTQTLTDWSEQSGLNIHTICGRINRGWPPSRWIEPVN